MRKKLPPGYTTDEFGELKRKPVKRKIGVPPEAEYEILERAGELARQAICAEEDRRVFEVLDTAMLTPEFLAFRDRWGAQFRVMLARFEREVMSAFTSGLAEVSRSQLEKRPRKSRKARKRKRG